MRATITSSIFFAAIAIGAPAPVPAPQTCQEYSCTLADLSGSTGEPVPAGAPLPPANNVTDIPTIAGGQTANGLNSTCLPVTVIFARGTDEGGNIGSIVGPEFEADLEAVLPGQVAFQGVDYDADVAGDTALGIPGGIVATQLLEQAHAECPNTALFMTGYSEGAMVAHDGVFNTTAATKAAITGVVVFGDPFDGAPIAGYPSSKIKTYCANGDEVCDGLFNISAAHLSYGGADSTLAAAYIKSAAGL